ncbi:acetyl-CoA acetyltransferase [Vibrio sp. MEBiC08052]|nr:acetyl-CoA acetyltransferase [Vibrio sp. MEBiC08052]
MLKSTSVGELGAIAVKAALEASGVATDKVDEVIIGNVVGAGQGMNVGRQASIYAGIPSFVPAYTLNMVCGSGMKTVMDGISHIRAGDANVVIAGGVEVMSAIPYAISGSIRDGHKMGNTQLTDLMVSDGLTDAFNQYHMGITAENIAKELGITRQEQDEFATTSQNKAVAAIEAGKFRDEIVPIKVKVRRNTVLFDTDEYPKPNITTEILAELRPAFDKEGTVTAGNASGINDGASAIVLASEQAVKDYQLIPIAEIVGYAQDGVNPKIMGLGPVGAVTKALEKAQLTIEDIDLFELNEAFAAQALGVIKQLSKIHKIDPQAILDKSNVNGGAIALGHPLGASGNRILVSLIYEMHKRSNRYGIASLCVGGGMGTAIIIKTV